jgi:NAD+ synthase/NAD+ synthase (glutamine-hydrolysing)
VAKAEQELLCLARETANLNLRIVVGNVAAANGKPGKRVLNTAAVLWQGREEFRQTKMLLPTYDVFDEGRYFFAAERQEAWVVQDWPVALTVCEDAWNSADFIEHPLYQRDPVEELHQRGARALLSINASPYEMGKRALRRKHFAAVAQEYAMPCVYVNSVGGNDHLVFDGSSFAMDARGQVIAEAPSFSEALVMVDLAAGEGERRGSHGNGKDGDELEAVYEALVLGTRDYVRKCGFSRVLIGLSGGIDSSLVAAIAVEALGRENVMGIGMPGPYSSDHSLTDAQEMAGRLGIRFAVSPITPAYQTMLETLAPLFADYQPDVTEENIQSRLRGLTLMALSNKYGALVLTTGNKSELAVGYCTLYGDMCGGLAVISDVPKTVVYELCRVANQRLAGAIPENVFVKPPSAELRPDQKDQDSLPPYEVLDRILAGYVEQQWSVAEIAAREGFDIGLVKEIARKVDLNEYKRQQAAPGLKVTSKAFGMGRRIPIAQRYRE